MHDITPPPSTDATLSALSVTGGGSELITNFASDTTNYPVSVANDVDEVTFALTTNHSGATVQYLGRGAVTLTDADDMEDGFQVALDVGVNALTLHVLAEDGTTANAYFVNVTRAAACTLNDGDIWCGVVTVGEIVASGNTYAHGFIDVTGLSAGTFAGETDIPVGSNTYTFVGLYVPVSGSFDGRVTLRANDNFTTAEQATLELHIDVDGTANTLVMSGFEDSTNGQMIAPGTDSDWSEATTVTARLRPLTLPTLSVADAEGDEDDGVEFTATLTTAVSAKVTATWTASIESGDTASAADLAATKTGEVEFDADATEAKFTVPLTDDTTDEPDQTFTVTLSGVSSNAQLAADPTAEGTIDDDDPAPTLTVADKRQDEDDIITNVTVSLSEVSEKRVRFRLRGLDRSGDTASLGVDWLQSPTSPFNSMSAGTMSVSRIALQVLNDTLDEDDETLTVEAYSLENAEGSSSDREATITIVDDDPTPTVTVADAAATEGGKVEFVVTLSAVSGRDVEVGYATSVATGQTATSDTDFTAATGTLTILASDSTDTGTVEVQTAEDDASESAETFTLTLSATKNVALGTPSTATGTINDAATDDCPADTTTTCAVDVGGSATGTSESAGDFDWFRVVLEADTRYQIDLEGAPTSRGTLANPAVSVRDASAMNLASDDNSGVGNNARVIYTPTAAGTYYVQTVGISGGDTGTYTLSVIVLGANGNSEADTDFPDTTSTTGRVEVGASATGNIDRLFDQDWFRVDLEADKTYQIDMKGEGGGGTLDDPRLYNIRDSDGDEIDETENDDIDFDNGILDSQIIYTPTAAGAYYLVAAHAGSGTGTYTLSVRDVTPASDDCPHVTTTTCVVDVGGSATGTFETDIDRDWFRVDLEAGTRYQIDVEGKDTGRGTLANPGIGLFDASATNLSQNDAVSGVGKNARVTYTPTATGAYYVQASNVNEQGTYTLSVIVLGANGNSEADADFPETTSTGGRVEVGASATGNIETGTDRDWFKVELGAGKFYQIDLEGNTGGGGALDDPYLRNIRDSSGTEISGTENDDIVGGVADSRVVFTPTADGAYYLVASTFAGDPGTYTLSVTELETRTAEGDTDFASSIATLGMVEVGGSATGEIDPASDIDWFRVVLEAGKTYVFDLKGTETGVGTLPDPLLLLWDSPGLRELARDNDGADGSDSRLEYTATASGIHYLDASAAGDESSNKGTYTLSVREVACTLNEGDIWCGVVTVGEILSGTNTFAYGFIDVTGLSAGSFGGETGITIGSNDYTFTGLYVPVGGSFEGHVILRANDNFTGTEQETLELHLVVDGTASTWPMSEFEDSTNGQMIAQETAFDWSEATTVTARLRPLTLPTVSVADAEGDEDVGVEFTATLTRAVSEEVTATWTASIESGDTASAADLATTKTGEVEFDVDATEATFTVPVNDDTDIEEDETFTVTLSGVSSNAQLATDPTAKGTIENDDWPPLAWSTTLTVGNHEFTTHLYGYIWGATGSLTDQHFEFGSNSYEVTVVAVNTDGTVHFYLDRSGLPTEDFVTLEIDGHEFPFEDRTSESSDQGWVWEAPAELHDPATNFPVGSTVAVCLRSEGQVCPAGNASPAFSSLLAYFDAAENQTVAGTVVATDSDTGDDVTGYAITVRDITFGTDQGAFNIGATDGVLTFKTAPNFEDPKDSDFENDYRVEVTATSGTGEREKTATQTIVVTVTNVDEGQSGTVTIDDTAPMVGDELTASTANAADPDGLPDPFAPGWKWYRTPDGGSETEITGETSATYTVVAADLGATLTAKASWTDNGGFANTLSSAPTGAVAAASTLPTLSVANGSATEGAVIAFPVTLTAAASAAVTVTCTASIESSDTAVAADLLTTTSTATINVGSTAATCPIATKQDSTDEENETFTVTLSNPSSNAQLATDPTAKGTILDDDTAPTVTGVAITSTPALATDTYGAGEEILFTVTFNEAVTVTGDPELAFSLDSGEDRAPYKSGSGTTALVFAYTVAPGDEDDDGIFLLDGSDFNNRVGPVTLDSDDAIKSTESATDADLAHTGRGTESGHKVDGSRSIVSVEVTSTPQLETDTYGAGETILFTVTFTAKVDVTGDPVLEFLFDGSEVRQASDVSGDGTTELVFSYTVVSGDDDDNGLFLRDESDYNNPDGPVRLDSDDEIEFHGTSTDAPLYWAGRGTQSGHKVDGSRTTGNVAPSFTSSAAFDAAENQTTAGTVLAADSDADDSVTGYAITGGADMALFEIGATSGELTFKSAPNFEDAQDQGTNNTYVVEVTATSGAGTREKTATQTITVTVTNVDTEAPGKPGAPTVSSASATSLSVNWSAPTNTGPAITDYDYRHRTTSPQGSWTEVTGTTITTLSATIGSLTENTSYDVQVRATNAEGTGSWSDSGSGTTDAAASDDCSYDTTTTCEVEVGGSATGNIENDLDSDWFKVELEADTRYQFDLEGAPSGRGTLPDPVLEIRSAADAIDADDDGGVGLNSRVIYTPTSSGTYYLSARKAGTTTGAYTLSVIVLGANGNSEADTDFPETTSTSGRVDVGASVTGTIGADTDADWFRVDLEAGKTYQFDLEGADTGRGTKPDPYVVLVNPAATIELEFDDHGGVGKNARLIYAVDETGTYYVDAGPGNDEQGTYTLSVRDVTPLEDLPADTTTTGEVEVDGSAVRGDILAPVFVKRTGDDVDGYDFDTDWFAVELEKDKTYRIDMKGAIPTNDLTLPLPQINAIYDADGDYLFNTWSRDESDSHHLFRVTFHAHDSGTHYIAASGESFEWGTYELRVKDIKDITEDNDEDTPAQQGAKNLRAVEEKGGVRLTWQPPDGAAVTGYRIERRRAGGQDSGPQRSHGQPGDHHTLVEDTGNTETSYVDESAEQGVEYEYRVTARNESGPGEESDWVRAGPEEEPVWGDGPPGAPRNLTATPGNREVSLSWDPPDDNGNAPATRYRIEWRVDGKDYDKNQWGTSRETTYTTNDQANLANGVKYFFRVKAENGSGNSYGPYGPASEEESATPTSGSAVVLGTPVLSEPEDLHHGMVQLDWQDIEDAGWYVVQHYHLEDEEWLDLPAEGVDIAFHGSSAVVSNLHGISWLRVGAASCAGSSEWSQIEQLFGTNASDWEGVPVPEVEEGDEIEPCPVVLGTPMLSDTEILHHGMVQLDWQDMEDAGWYVVQYYHLEDEEWLDLPAEGVDIAFHGSSAVVSNLHGLSWLRVGAASCDGASEWSQIEQLFGTNESDWDGVPVPEVEEGDEIEPCSEDADTPDNSPATGAPTISGTSQVGERLTANTSGIADADGLANATFSYQWLADDSDISGATNATYTLTDSEESKAVKVQVSFTDDADNGETLTSAATGAVAGAQPTEPPDKPTGLEATASHGQVVLTWDDPGDDSITGYVILRRVPGVDPEGQFDELVADTGTAATTYTDDTVAVGTTYTYRIKAINGAGTSERSRWFHIDIPAVP